MQFPALKLLWSPGHVLLNGHEWAHRTVVPIPKVGLRIGGQGDVRAQGVLQDHCLIGPRVINETHWPAVSAGPEQLLLSHHKAFSLVNGRPRKEAWLSHRDLVELPGGLLFRVLEREDIEVSSNALETAIAAAPNDPVLFHVWRDFLLDMGDPLGERIAKAKAGEQLDDARWLDSFAPLYEMGRLQIEWSNGLAVRAVLRDTESGFESLERALILLFSLRVMRFLRELVLDVSSDKHTIADGLLALRAVALPTTLKSVGLGDVSEADRPVAELALALDLKRHGPFPLALDLGFFRDAQVEVLARGPKLPHAIGDRINVGPHLELVRRPAALSASSSEDDVCTRSSSHDPEDYARYSILRDGPRYLLTRPRSLGDRPKANGYAVDDFPLRDGDTIELGDSLTVRFTLLR